VFLSPKVVGFTFGGKTIWERAVLVGGMEALRRKKKSISSFVEFDRWKKVEILTQIF
jgi:hypothetical protein